MKALAGGRQLLSVGDECKRRGIIVHELLHTLGFFHEQARPDASKYVTINYANINPFRYNNFLPAETSEVEFIKCTSRLIPLLL